MDEETTFLIEAEGQSSVTITVEAAPTIVFSEEGLQGPPGIPGPAGESIGGYDPGDLTLIFDNQLI